MNEESYVQGERSWDVHGRTTCITSHQRKENPVVLETSKMKIDIPVGLTRRQNCADAMKWDVGREMGKQIAKCNAGNKV